jgi:transcriptional regulator with XRE-family HTH domain
VAFYTSTGNYPGVPTYSTRRKKDPALVALGEAIQRLRNASGLSQEHLALVAEVDRSYMSGVERGVSNVTVLNLIKIATAMGVPASDLMEQAGL